MPERKVRITFHGGVGDVTGANFLIEAIGLEKSIRILIDCGMFQGTKIADDHNRDPFPYDPTSIDYLLVTHAHIDHVGRIPKLVRDGFKGAIYSTPPTKDIAEVMLVDSLGVLEREARHENLQPFYSETDVEAGMRLWQCVPYRTNFNLGPFTISFRDAGHTLGSSSIELVIEGKKIVFTGDLGNSPTPLLRDAEFITDIDYLIIESVYGDRIHEKREERKEILEQTIEQTIKKDGTLMIPSFSLERTQELLYEIERMMEGDKIPLVPVFIDSPLAIKVTEIYKRYEDYFNKEVRYIISSGNELFQFPQLHMTMTSDESKEIFTKYTVPKVVIAGSGMSNGGRILHHEKHYLPDPNSTLLLVGYQAVRTLGRRLQEGQKLVRINGEDVAVNAHVVTLSGYSGHRDSQGLLDYVSQTVDTLKKVYCVMGEQKSALFLVQRIRDFLGVDATAPLPGEFTEIVL